jgi:3'-5' exoribonuclease
MKKIFVNELKPGESINDIFSIPEKSLAKKRNGESFVMLKIGDKTGTLKGVVWDNVERIYNVISSNDYVYISGDVSEYKGECQIVVKNAKPCEPNDDLSKDFIPCTPLDIDSLFDRLLKQIDKIETEHIKELLKSFFCNEEFARKFKTAPAGKSMHHAYLGGLLEHSLSVTLLALKIASHYKGINMDMLAAGAMLHDIGKVDELNYKYNIGYSDEGMLLNHIVIGIEMISRNISKIEDFPEKDAMLLKHLIVSHHGIRAFGSPEPPKTIEAVLLNYIDEIDSKINGIRKFIEQEKNDSSWTSYHKFYERYFYKAD